MKPETQFFFQSRWLLFFIVTLFLLHPFSTQGQLQGLKTEYEATPLGIDLPQPRFSWQMQTHAEQFNQYQKAYQIKVYDENQNTVWETQKVNSAVALGIRYEGSPLKARTRYLWKLKVWNEKDAVLEGESWFETGFMAALSQFENATWIGSNQLSFYAQYTSVYALEYTLQLPNFGSAAMVFGANDERLRDRNLNLQGVENTLNQSYIKMELDTRALSQGGVAQFHVYRVGYAPGDSDQQAFASFPISAALLNAENAREAHTFFAFSNFGMFSFYIDKIDAEHRINPDPKGGSPYGPKGLNLNPIGPGNNFISYPMVAEIGVSVPQGQSAQFSQLQVKNYRYPNNTLFSSEDQPLDFQNDQITTQDGVYTVNAEKAAVFAVEDPSHSGTPLLRTTFDLAPKKIVKARIYATARGIYELYLNGKRVGDAYFNPGLTQYNRTHLYQTFDVTDLLLEGSNAWGVGLSEGWWSGNITYSGEHWNYFGDRQSFMGKLVVTYEDGTETIINTQPKDWKTFVEGPIRLGSFFQGEVYDARKEAAIEGWTWANYDATAWAPAQEISMEESSTAGEVSDPEGRKHGLDYSKMKLTGQLDAQVKIHWQLPAKELFEPRPKVYVYDMGQNMVGFPSIKIKNGKAGTKIRLRYAEMRYPDMEEYAENKGMIMLENIRAALAQDIYILKGGDEVIQPRFTFHGYRYMEVTGLDAPLPLEAVSGNVLSSVDAIDSYYSSSDSLVNKLWENITWSLRSNFLSIPTDTPARNERMGWSGDISVFSKTATYMASVNNFLRRHALAMRETQSEQGRFPDVAPMGGGFGGTLWGSAGIVVPWETYQQYGDIDLLKEHYPAMKKYLAFLQSKENELGIPLEGPLGDWLSPEGYKNDDTLLWMAYYIYDLDILQKTATLLRLPEEASVFETQLQRKKAIFNRVYLAANAQSIRSGIQTRKMGVVDASLDTSAGTLMDTQASYAIPLNLGIVSDETGKQMATHLVQAIQRENKDELGVMRAPYSLMTGFIGTASINGALSRYGKDAVAYGLLTHRSYPSWLYPVVNGATTIWERLNSYTHENGFGGNNSMNSFNHYSFGSVAGWMFEYSLGIQRAPNATGFQHFILNPRVDPERRITHAEGSITTPYGVIASGWKATSSGGWDHQFEIPANTTATLKLPINKKSKLQLNGRRWQPKKEWDARTEYYQVIADLPSGKYHITVE